MSDKKTIYDEISEHAEYLNAGCTCNRAGLCQYCQDATMVRRWGTALRSAVAEVERLLAVIENK